MVLSDNIRGASLMAASMAAFVLNDALMKLASSEAPLFQALFLRGLITTALLGALVLWRREFSLRLPPGQRLILFLRLCGEVGATICFLTALFNMALANVTAILQVMPLAVTLGAAIFLREPVGWRRWSAIAVGFSGVLIIVRPGSEGFNEYSLLALLSVCFVVLRDLSTRRLDVKVPSTLVALLTSVAITAMGGLMTLQSDWQSLSDTTMVYLAGASCFLIFGYLFSVMTMRVGEISFVAPFRYTIMIWAILLGILVFGDYPDGWTLVGSAVVVLTGIYSFHRERQRRLLAARTPSRNP